MYNTKYLDDILKSTPVVSSLSNILEGTFFPDGILVEYMTRAQCFLATMFKLLPRTKLLVNLSFSTELRPVLLPIMTGTQDNVLTLVIFGGDDAERARYIELQRLKSKNLVYHRQLDMVEEIELAENDAEMPYVYKWSEISQTLNTMQTLFEMGSPVTAPLVASFIGGGLNIRNFLFHLPPSVQFVYWNPDKSDSVLDDFDKRGMLSVYKIVYDTEHQNIMSKNNRVIVLRNTNFTPF